MPLLSILLVEDEPLSRKRLKSLLLEYDPEFIIEQASDGIQALALLEKNQYQLVLLDIKIPGMDGIALSDRIKLLNNPPAIIYTTAYSNFALRAFTFPAVGYLLKPINPKQLSEVLKTVTRTHRGQDPNYTQNDSFIIDYVDGKGEKVILRMPIHEVFACHSEDKQCWIITSQTSYPTNYTLKDIEEQFANVFLRIHRNCLVNKSKIRSLESNEFGHFVNIKDHPSKFAVSRQQWHEVKEFFTQLLAHEKINHHRN
ncbi:MAG: LytTR family DNA-binding domain-containing protein [Methylacidiphilales bacterium]|nr:LytTR family DNA-binding domain-containing protein [Candidatus Methylacidiphilales bacterium]